MVMGAGSERAQDPRYRVRHRPQLAIRFLRTVSSSRSAFPS